jgi:hypothetical protein
MGGQIYQEDFDMKPSWLAVLGFFADVVGLITGILAIVLLVARLFS